MSYRANNDGRQERKMGVEAVKDLKADPNYDADFQLRLAQRNLDNYKIIDDMDDASFVKEMEDVRQNNPNAYVNFWWWRLAEEEKGKRQEDDDGKREPRYRTFMITQFLAKPFSDDWNDDRVTLKPGVTPLITEQQIAEGLDHKSIRKWAWIWHDRDIYTEEDEITDRDGLRKAGERKFKHAHVVISAPGALTVSQVARWFQVPEAMVEVLHGRSAFLDSVEYLPHESPKAVAAGKTHYDYDEIKASEGFDFPRELADLQAHREKFGKRAGDMTLADTMRMHVLQDGWTMRQCRDEDPLTYAKIKSTLPQLRLDYLLDAPPCPFRLTIYIDGPGGIGKSSFSRYIAEAMFPNVENSYFMIGNDERVTFDGYDGEPVIIYDDVRAESFIGQFTRSGTFRLLDPVPTKTSQQAKYSRIILNNAVNIINGVQPYNEFIAGLAGTYTDKKGVSHVAEDENQAYRRFPMILCIHSDDFDILLNEGFVNDDLDAAKKFKVFCRVQSNLKLVMQRLEGEAKDLVLQSAVVPVLEAAKMITDKQDNKISDPEQVPDNMLPVVKDEEVLKAEAEEKERKRAEAEKKRKAAEEERARKLKEKEDLERAQKKEKDRQDTLHSFCYWFWGRGNQYERYKQEHVLMRPFKGHEDQYVRKIMEDDAFAEKEIEKAIKLYVEDPHMVIGKDVRLSDYALGLIIKDLESFSLDEIRKALESALEKSNSDAWMHEFNVY